MLAYCGIKCDECASYTGTISGDHSMLEKMNQEFGNERTTSIDFVCLGCKFGDIRLIATDCAACKIRSCAKAKGKDFCATCEVYDTCEIVEPYRGDGSSTRDKMNAFIRQKYFHANG